MKRFNNILCVLETGNTGKSILERAVVLAENNQASLTVIEVTERIAAGAELPETVTITADLQNAMVNSLEQDLAALIEPYRMRIGIKTKVLVGTPFLEIVREVLRSGYDLVVKSPETQDWLDRLFGSDDMHLLRKCPCPVWLIKRQAPTSYRRILAAVDVDDAYSTAELESRRMMNLHILELASSLALSDFAELHVVHAWHAAGEGIMRGGFMRMQEEEVIDYVDHVKRQHAVGLDALMHEVNSHMERESLEYLKPQSHLVMGNPRQEIPVLARKIEAELVVMGTVARTGIPGFIVGNTAETILNQLDCSVLAIKPAGFITPVTLDE